jgi:hypothetical protein
MPTSSFKVGIGADDGCVINAGTAFYNDSEIWIGYGPNNGFFRIPNVTIPKGAVIDNAYINVYLYSYDGAGEYKYRIYACNEDNPNTVSSYADYFARELTENYVDWNPSFEGLNWYWSRDYSAPDIKIIIQEIINRSNWVNGNAIMLMIKDNGSAKSSYWDYYEDTGYELELEITYHMPEIVTPDTLMQNSFKTNRLESFEFELLSLNNERYENAGWVTDYVIKNSGNINIDFTRDVIGTFNCNIRNNTDINYLSDLIRPWYVLNDTYRFPLGTYMLSSPKKKSDSKLVTRPIQGYDLLLALEQDKMINSYTIEAGTNVITAIETLLYIVGANLWVNADITPSDEILSTDVSYELGKSKLFIINSLLNMINYYPLWADGKGVFRSIPWTNEPNVTYSFIDDNLSIYTPNIELTLDYTNMYNRVVIINNQLVQDTQPLYKVWTFEDENLESHPLSYSSLGRYITKIFQSEAVSQDYVDLRARRELLKMLEIEESVKYNHAFISSRENDGLPWQGDCYRFKNSLLDVDSIYKMEVFTYNLKVGNLVNTQIKRIRSTY